MIRDTIRWDRPYAALRDARGPERTNSETPDPDFVHRPVGFAPPDTPPPVKPVKSSKGGRHRDG